MSGARQVSDRNWRMDASVMRYWAASSVTDFPRLL